MRALSPILSAVILLMATLAAGAIMYQYFIDTIETVADKPILYAYNAEYLQDLGIVYVTLDNSGSQVVNITAVHIDCANGEALDIPISQVIDAGETKSLRVSINKTICPTPSVMVIEYDMGDKTYTTEPIKIS
ncbi:archaeal flagellin N-terminal-like domain [Pyrodictium delaneyi]|uniref:Archaeal flagellin N-terminal-like domain n=1 Tax=Pyrodictium delaneyi TaxID=1273541 RepID=A0A0P0N4S9_9CREN|nr:archaellin/type IV pilin N-terminal domain-containing protein [Pyrodictium delaneyi]ALL01733.1 archaeal flagellin N-terminal-like domain [Pyrodictium delaneyi]OWJ55043.1 hypothetical protein Pdsh_04960 [Pyrodictium delaneyi]